MTAQKEFREANRLEIYMVCTSVSETYLLTQIKSINNLNEHTFQHNKSKKWHKNITLPTQLNAGKWLLSKRHNYKKIKNVQQKSVFHLSCQMTCCFIRKLHQHTESKCTHKLAYMHNHVWRNTQHWQFQRLWCVSLFKTIVNFCLVT